jgi:hypothetical protein
VQIQKFALWFENLEPVSASLRKDKHARVVKRQLFSVPLEEGRRAGPKVDCDIPDLSAQTSDHFEFRVGGALKVQASHCAYCHGLGMIDLHNATIANNLFEFAVAKNALEDTALIGEWRRFDHYDTCDGSRRVFHARLHDTPSSVASCM